MLLMVQMWNDEKEWSTKQIVTFLMKNILLPLTDGILPELLINFLMTPKITPVLLLIW